MDDDTYRNTPASVLTDAEIAAKRMRLSAIYVDRAADDRLRRHLESALANREAFLSSNVPDVKWRIASS